MSRERLREAIKYYSEEASLSHSEKMDDFIAVLLAAARAYACPTCDGCREVDESGVPRMEWEKLPKRSRAAYDMGLVEFRSCPDCKEFRKIADGEGE